MLKISSNISNNIRLIIRGNCKDLKLLLLWDMETSEGLSIVMDMETYEGLSIVMVE
jgi:hypothetical protein